MTNNWIARTWDRVVETRDMSGGYATSHFADEYQRAVDTWLLTCEIILAQAPAKHQGETFDNRRRTRR